MTRQPTPDILTDVLNGPPLAGDIVRAIPVERLRANPFQRRSVAIADDDPSLVELSTDIAQHGIHQPLVVRPDSSEPGCYQIAAGHRRHAAARLVGLATVPCLIRDLDDRQMLDVVFAENYHRADISPIDRAEIIAEYVAAGLTHQEIADRLSLARPTVSNALRLLKLPDDVRTALVSGQISQRQADALSPLLSLPAANLKRLSDWDKPANLLKDASNGASSDAIRARAASSVNSATRPLPEHWAERDFADLAGIDDARCINCASVIRNAGETRCINLACWDLKSSAWQAIENAQVVAATGVPMLPEDAKYDTYTEFYSHARAQLQLPDPPAPPPPPLCPNLRLRRGYKDTFNYLCYHPGKKGYCACLTKIDRDAKKDGTAAWKAIKTSTARALSTHLATFDIDALRLLAWSPASWDQRNTLAAWTAAQCIAIIVPGLVNRHEPYEAHKTIPKARAAMEELLDLAGVNCYPWSLAGQDTADPGDDSTIPVL